MKIVVLLKVVPDTETKFQINADGTDVMEDNNISWIINPYDEYAVEEAIQIKEKVGAEVISVTIGQSKGKEDKSIRKAMAMGVDSGILIENIELYQSDPLSMAKAVAEIIKPLNADLIMTGKTTSDSSESALGPAIAALINVPIIAEVSEFEPTADKMVAIRDVAGRKEKFELSYPFVMTTDKGKNEPRYPKLPLIVKAKKKPLDKKADAGVPINNTITQLSVTLPPAKGSGMKITGSPDELVEKLVDGLKTKEKII